MQSNFESAHKYTTHSIKDMHGAHERHAWIKMSTPKWKPRLDQLRRMLHGNRCFSHYISCRAGVIRIYSDDRQHLMCQLWTHARFVWSVSVKVYIMYAHIQTCDSCTWGIWPLFVIHHPPFDWLCRPFQVCLLYDHFHVGTNYRLTIGGCQQWGTGEAGNSMTGSHSLNGMQFSTREKTMTCPAIPSVMVQ